MTAFNGGKVVGPGKGTLLLNGRWWLPVQPNDTPGRLAIMEAVLPPGSRAPRIHRHHETDEIWYILDGQLTFRRAMGCVDATNSVEMATALGGSR
jgi:quercetin dioxygenase-like cupin family protein